jgi:hypothetical protein
MILEPIEYFKDKINEAQTLVIQMLNDLPTVCLKCTHLGEWQAKYIEFFTNFAFDYINLVASLKAYRKLLADSQKDFHMGFITHLCWQNGVPYNPVIPEMIYNGLTPSARNQRNVNLLVDEIRETYKDLKI